VAVVGSAVISRAAFDHWATVANDAGQASTGKAAPPLPVPPDYTACIASLGAQPAHSGASAAALKALCATSYHSLVSEVMDFLVQAIWIEGEANSRSVSVTAAQIDASYQSQRHSSKPPLDTTSELNAFLAKSGQTRRDLKWRTRLNLLATAIQRESTAVARHVSAASIDAYYSAHRSEFTGESLQAATPQIRKLIATEQTSAANKALQTRFSAVWHVRTVCLAGFDVTTSCSRASGTIAADPTASYPGTIVAPPSQAQTRTFIPKAPAATVTTPASGPLSSEPSIPPSSGPPPTTLQTVDLITGTGATAQAGDTITVNYVGALYGSGKVFDSSWSRNATFTTALTKTAVIEGWVDGIAGMRVGGRRELIIPPSLAYGNISQATIPANSTLIFVVDLLAVSH
jgi:peptidylprolyl isomerase